MVKIKLVPSRKRYLRGKRVYEYLRPYLPVPRKLFGRLQPYFKDDFRTEMAEDDKNVTLMYTCRKTPSSRTDRPHAPEAAG